MNPDTCAALRLLGLALTAHPEDLEAITLYIDGEGLADLFDDYIEDSEEEED